MKNKDFEEGVRYERIRENRTFLLFMGWGCIIFSVIITILSVIGKSFFDVWELLLLFVLGFIFLCLAYLEKKAVKRSPPKRTRIRR